jgi:hypothetical protein
VQHGAIVNRNQAISIACSVLTVCSSRYAVAEVEMLDERQISDMESRMREEHRKDLEALERLKKYLPTPTSNGVTSVPLVPASRTPRVRSIGRRTRAGGGRTGLTNEVLAIITEARDQQEIWSRAEVQEALNKRMFVVTASDPVAAINQALKALVGRGDLFIVRQGSGSSPSLYSLNRDAIPF